MTHAAAPCFQCGLPAPHPVEGLLDGAPRVYCCHGCKLAAELIADQGLLSFYARREGVAEPPRELEYPYDDAEFVARISRAAGPHREVALELDGLHCAACIWLIEKVLARTAGVHQVHVNLTAHRLTLRWDPAVVPLADLAALVARLGYAPSPYDPSGRDRAAAARLRTLLLRLGIAGLAAAGAMYLGDPLNRGGFAPHEQYLRLMLTWAAWGITTPAAVFAGWPFFRGAWTGLKAGVLTMDATISLAALAAYMASVWAALSGRGAIYFDCVMMLFFALLVGRTVEQMARRDVFSRAERHWRLEAPVAHLVVGDQEQRVATSSIKAGDRLRVRPGEKIPVDGRILEGAAGIDEALLTGEALPVRRGPGDAVTAGTVALDGAFLMVAERVGEGTTLSQIVRWVQDADAARAPSQRLADRLAAWFLPLLLLVAGLTFLLNRGLGFDAALARTVSVLIVTCPCALGLATPAAIAVAMATGARAGLLFKGGAELEALAMLTHLALDKTGTLTTGQLQLKAVHALPGEDADLLLELALALEDASEHPLARAIASEARRRGLTPPPVADFRAVPGSGVTGVVAGQQVALGTPRFLGAPVPMALPAPAPDENAVYLARDGRIVGWLALVDTVRAETPATLAALQERGLVLELLSGDRPELVAGLAAQLGLATARSGLDPAAKRARLQELAAQGHRVGMVGDGLNDAPALAAAEVGIALGHGPALTTSAAGVVLLGDRLDQLLDAIQLSQRTRRLIRSNFLLSLAYNLAVIPLAAAGMIAPQWAAWLMPLSSLLVLGNSLRLMR